MPESLPIAVAALVVFAVVVREVVRWRGGRWRRSGPRGDQPDDLGR